MTIYVDDLRHHRPSGRLARRYGEMWCHMWADTEKELHEFAGRLQIKRGWYQPHQRLGHYDLTPNKREVAIEAGAIRIPAAEWLRKRIGQ